MFRLIIFRFRLGPWLVGLLIFTGYWGLPAVLAAFSGTLVTRESIAALMADLPAPLLQLGVHQALLDAQKLQTGLAYLNDSSHFVFAALLSLGGAAAALILARIHSTVGVLSADGILSDDSLTLKTYRRFHGAANHWFARVASLVLAGLTGVLFVSFHFAEAYSYWWGHHQHGLAGYPTADALLDLIERSSATRWHDEFYNHTFDVSTAIVIATANDPDRIDAPLRSRFQSFDVKAPRPDQMLAMVRSVWRHYRQMRHDLVLPKALDDEVVARIAHSAEDARAVMRLLDRALAHAAERGGRIKVGVADLRPRKPESVYLAGPDDSAARH